MSSVKQRFVAVATLAIAITGVSAFSQQSDGSQRANTVELNAIIDACVKSSARIKSLSARFSRKDKRRSLSDTGEFIYEVLWKDSGQADLKIEATVRKGKPELFERIIWTGREVWRYNPRRKEIEVSSLDEIGHYEEFRQWIGESWWNRWLGNSFDLIFPTLSNPREVDPLPFLIGMKAIVAKKLFKFERLDDNDSPGLLIRATPLNPELRTSFNDILITLDKERYLPIAIEYRRGWRNKDTRRYTFLEVKLDLPLANSSFEPHKPEGWQIKSPGS
jgi:outer membrane lipoprotein-sorting protein